MTSPEHQLEQELIDKLRDLKYEYRPDIRDRGTLESNFRGEFAALSRVRRIDGEFQRLPIYKHAAPDNTKIRGRDAFAEAFLAKCTLGHTISRYMALVATGQKLLMSGRTRSTPSGTSSGKSARTEVTGPTILQYTHAYFLGIG